MVKVSKHLGRRHKCVSCDNPNAVLREAVRITAGIRCIYHCHECGLEWPLWLEWLLHEGEWPELERRAQADGWVRP